jgi:hypothetical protein
MSKGQWTGSQQRLDSPSAPTKDDPGRRTYIYLKTSGYKLAAVWTIFFKTN